jgi:cell division septation protein DedD
MKTTILAFFKFTIFAAAFLLSAAATGSVYAQEGSSSTHKLIPTQERIPQADWRINPEYIIPPIGNPPFSHAERRDAAPVEPPAALNAPQFKALLVSELERGKWYVQIGAYARAAHVEDAIKRAETAGAVVIQNAGTDIDPMFRVLLGPFSQSESKTVLQRVRNKGYDAFLRSGN